MAISSHVADTAEDNRTIGTPELRIHIWSLANRIAFRFVFSYLILYIFPFPFGSYPGRVYPFPAYDKMWYAFVPWVGKHILHLRNAITVFPAGSGDTTFNYVQLLCFVVLAAVATIVWTLLDRKRAEYRTLHEWLRIYVRYALAFTMLAYGMDKVIKLQFPDPGLGKLAEPFGNYSPISLLWTFMGYSTAYTHFAGAGEVIGAVLLFFRRTTTLGALILCGVLANVVAMNFCYDVPVKIFSSSLLLMAIFLAAPEAKRLCDMFVLNRPVAAANLDPPLRMRWMRIGRLIVKTIVIIFALCWFTLPYLRVARLRANMPRPPIYGLYQVESFTQNGKPATVSDASWRRVIFEYRGQMSAMAMDDSEQDYRTVYDGAKNSVTISAADDKSQKSVLIYSRPDAEHLVLSGEFMNQPVVIQMKKVDASKFLLVSRGFRWIQEHPFYE